LDALNLFVLHQKLELLKAVEESIKIEENKDENI